METTLFLYGLNMQPPFPGKLPILQTLGSQPSLSTPRNLLEQTGMAFWATCENIL